MNKIRQHAEARQQQQQVQTNPQVNSEDLHIDKNNFMLGKPFPKVNLHQQLYPSKPSKITAWHYSLIRLKKNFLTQIT